MANIWAGDRRRRFYLAMALIGLAAVAIGFSTTYFLPLARRSFSAPLVVHLHGGLAIGWVLLFLVQAMLVRNERSRWHRKAGLIGLPLALGVLLTGVGTGLWAAQRDAARFGADAFGGLTGTVTSLLLFTVLVAIAIQLRRRPDWHKRLLLLATIVVLWPAYFRFRHLMPFVPRPEIILALLLADLPILLAAVRDRVRYGQVHPAYKWVGSSIFLEQCVEIALFGTPAWNAAGRALYDALA